MSSYTKERIAIESGLIAQGVRTRLAKQNGIIFYLPNSFVVTLHESISDHRGLKNFRSIVRQAGLLWPLDPDYPKHLK